MPFDPAGTLSENDPLREWAKNLETDPVLGTLLLTDPQAAIDRMVAKGVPPPNTGTSAFSEPSRDQIPDYGNAKPASVPLPPERTPNPPFTPGVPPTSIFGRLGLGQGKPAAAEVVTDPTADQGPHRLPSAGATKAWRDSTPLPGTVPVAAAATPFDPAPVPSPPVVPLPVERPAEAGAGASDVSAKKKPDLGDALTDFSKSFAGVKPIPPPALNPVGTPSVRTPHAAGAPSIAALLQYMGQTAQPSALSNLGRLLVAGKA